MTRSASTPRLRFTALYYAALVATAALTAPQRPAGIAVQLASLLLVAFACLGRIWCSVFIAGRKDADLVTAGPYSIARHPLYSLSFVGGLGLSMATGSIVLIVVTALMLGSLLAAAARREERWLAARHTEAYRRYAASTRRWWPRRSTEPLPGSMLVYPDVLWKSFVDAGAFFLLYAILLAAIALRTTGALPTLATLP
ncbi:MAG: isoprenylcysteine carboxylmethyltransferase family protein [Steroidobacteraceae bacterium]